MEISFLERPLDVARAMVLGVGFSQRIAKNCQSLNGLVLGDANVYAYVIRQLDNTPASNKLKSILMIVLRLDGIACVCQY